jgi:hypothetical protein
VLVIRRIRVVLRLEAPETDWDTARRVHSFFANQCPVYRSLKPAIEMTTELILESPRGAA